MPRKISEVRKIEMGRLPMGDPGMFLNDLNRMISTLLLMIESQIYSDSVIQKRLKNDLDFLAVYREKLTYPNLSNNDNFRPAETEIPL
ncbi:hypothetical protein GCM10027442_38740 [Emticicia fontis]